MINDEKILLGDTVDLAGNKTALYRTKIEDLGPNGLFLAGIPRSGRVPMPLNPGEDIFLVFYRQSGRFIVRMNVVGLEKRGNVRYVWLCQKTKPYRNQRREAFRVPVSIKVRVRECPKQTVPDETTVPAEAINHAGRANSAETHNLEYADIENLIVLEEAGSKDISVSGISFLTKREYETGGNLILEIFLNGNNDKRFHFITHATVKRCAPWRESGKNQAGLRFYGLSRSRRDFISKFVMEEQRRQLKQKGLSQAPGSRWVVME